MRRVVSLDGEWVGSNEETIARHFPYNEAFVLYTGQELLYRVVQMDCYYVRLPNTSSLW